MMSTSRITTQQSVNHTAPTLTVLVKYKKYTPCQGVAHGHNTDCQSHIKFMFHQVWCGFDWQGVFFFLPAQF